MTTSMASSRKSTEKLNPSASMDRSPLRSRRVENYEDVIHRLAQYSGGTTSSNPITARRNNRSANSCYI